MTLEGLRATPVTLVGVEVCTPLGFDAATSTSEMLAGSVVFGETETTDAKGEPLRASRLSLIADGASRTERMVALAATALRAHLETVEVLRGRSSLHRIPVFLALPEEGFAGDVVVGAMRRALTEVAESVAPGLRLEFPASGAVASGRAGVFHALALAMAELESGRARAVLVGGVDSWCDPVSLAYLAAAKRVLGEENSDGLIPGEGAGFALVVPAAMKIPEELDALRLLAVAIGREQRHFLQNEPNLAKGLAGVFRCLRTDARAGSRRADLVLSCQTGESYWAEEFSRAYLRNAALMPEPLRISLVAEGLGDIGAASGMVQLAAAITRAKRGDEIASAELSLALSLPAGSSPRGSAAPRRAVIYGCSDTGLAGGCVVDAVLGTGAGTGTGTGVAVSSSASSAGRKASADRTSEKKPGVFSRATELGRQLCEEHFDEIGFLLRQRLVYFADPELQWKSVANLDERLLRHVDAARAWGLRRILEVAKTAIATDAGDDAALGAVFALASFGGAPEPCLLLSKVLESDSMEEDHLPHCLHALSLALDAESARRLTGLLHSQRPEVVAGMATVLGHRRAGGVTALRALLAPHGEAPLGVREAAAMALAKLGAQGAAADVLSAQRANPDSPALLEAALCLGRAQAIGVARRVVGGGAPVHPRTSVLLALAGTSQDAELLLRARSEAKEERIAVCTALGVLGEPRTVPALLERLSDADEGVRVAAAMALQRITNACLREKVWVPDADTPTTAEGQPANPEGEEAGSGCEGCEDEGAWIERVSTQAELWRTWWDARAKAFSPGTRYRLGRPFNPQSCVLELEAPATPQNERRLALDELRIRSGRSVPFEVDDFVVRQVVGLAACKQWPSEAERRGE